jgi:uncharacterized protein
MKKSKLGKINLIILAIFVVSALGLKVWQYHWTTELVTLKDEPLLVQIAKTPYHHTKGLSGRNSLGKYDGMLFVFTERSQIGIVMREMSFPIDIIWLDRGKVVDIAPNVQVEDVPEDDLTRYFPRVYANLVLELSAGWVEEHDLRIGDMLTVVGE